ncbi:hypothetical protein [Methylovulum miyakonense]|uniref:hypothetical protein n=1 Tax=Methylovulum miyakonense TaxID=645578 RepID=UPI003BB61BD9
MDIGNNSIGYSRVFLLWFCARLRRDVRSIGGIKKTLSSKELESVNSQSWVCPNEFTYITVEGKEMRVFGIPDFIHGPKVYFRDANAD